MTEVIELSRTIVFASPGPAAYLLAPAHLETTMTSPRFLKAEWRHLVMLNYTVSPEVLQPLVPKGTELDFFKNRVLVSLVGFQFLNTRLFGIPFPRHTNFEEVNLRFYVRRKSEEGWRRGVVFIRELVPRRAIAFIARTFYGEPYSALPMRHKIQCSESGIRVEYFWLRTSRWESVHATGIGDPESIENGSEEEFITEHYWGYTAHRNGCREYQVEHPQWQVWRCAEAGLNADVAALYGEPFYDYLSAHPVSRLLQWVHPFPSDGAQLYSPPKASDRYRESLRRREQSAFGARLLFQG